jgi:hypothetical protein
VPLSTADQQAIDQMTGGGVAALVLLRREAAGLRAAFAALSGAQRSAFAASYPTLVPWLQSMSAALDGPLPADYVATTRARERRIARAARALMELVASGTRPTIAQLRQALIDAGGTPGEVEPVGEHES